MDQNHPVSKETGKAVLLHPCVPTSALWHCVCTGTESKARTKDESRVNLSGKWKGNYDAVSFAVALTLLCQVKGITLHSLAKVCTIAELILLKKNFPQIRFLYICRQVNYDLSFIIWENHTHLFLWHLASCPGKVQRPQQIPNSLPHPSLAAWHLNPSFHFKIHWFSLTSLLNYRIFPFCYNTYHCHAYHWWN